MKLKREHLLGALMAVLPFVVWPGLFDDQRFGKVKALLIVSCAYGAFYVYKKISRSLSLAFLFIGVSAVASTPWISTTGVLFCLSVLFSFSVIGLDKNQISVFLDSIIAGSVLSALYGFMQTKGIDPILLCYSGMDCTKPTALIGQQTLLGPFLVCGFIASAFKKRMICLSFILFIIFKTESTATYLSLAIGILGIGYYFLNLKYFLSILLITTIVCGYIAVNRTFRYTLMNDQGRFKLWERTITLAKDRPFFGHGIGAFKKQYYKDHQTKEEKERHGYFLEAHNEYVQNFYDLGYTGLLLSLICLFEFAFFSLIHRNVKEVFALSIILQSLLVNSIANFPLRVLPTALIALWCYVILVTYKEGIHGSSRFLQLFGPSDRSC